MKVRIRDIPPRGLRIQATMDLRSLQQRILGEGEEGRFVFTEAPRVDLMIHRASHGGLVKGTLEGKYRQTCALCLEDVERELRLDADFMVRERPEDVPEDDPQYQDDVGVFHFTSDQVDLERILEEVIILSLSLYWHPPLEKETCIQCGRRFGEGGAAATEGTQKLGDILKKAGL